jgi:hypothetical protein
MTAEQKIALLLDAFAVEVVELAKTAGVRNAQVWRAELFGWPPRLILVEVHGGVPADVPGFREVARIVSARMLHEPRGHVRSIEPSDGKIRIHVVLKERSIPADERRRKIVVHDPLHFDDPCEGYVSRSDAVRYLLATGWRRDGEWFVRGPEGDEDLILAGGASLPVFVARVAAAEGVPPRSLLRAIEALAKRCAE